jgi:3-oxoacid CoA-transferase
MEMVRSFYSTWLVKCSYSAGTSNQLSDVIKELGGTKGFIITGRSLYEKTPVIKNIEKSLGSAHGGTFSKIGQHA